jgi:DNA-binding NarL/FixJ family response regulator
MATGKKDPTHIFVVENNKIYVKMLDYIFLKDINYRFINYTSGEECLQNMHLKPDFVAVDYTLPGMNGYETLLKIKKEHPNVHVLMLMSDSDGKLPSELFEAGADDYIIKETSGGQEINEKIETFLKRQNLSKKVAPERTIKPSVIRIAYYLLFFILLFAGVYSTTNW